MKTLTIALVFCALMLAGCGIDYKAEIQSDVVWYGTFDGVDYTGTAGNRTINFSGDPPHCVEVHLNYSPGYLVLQLKEEGGWFLNSTDDYDPVRITSWRGYEDTYRTDGPAVDCTKD